MATCFREEGEIRTVPCNVSGCQFASHIYGVWNTHVILHLYVQTFGKANAAIFIGEPRSWVYNRQQDTLTPPIAILRAVGSAVIWLRTQYPAVEYDYSLAYSFPPNFPHHIKDRGPPENELPKVEDVMSYVVTHNFLHVIRLSVPELWELDDGNSNEPHNEEAANDENNLFHSTARDTPAAAASHDIDYRRQALHDVDMREHEAPLGDVPRHLVYANENPRNPALQPAPVPSDAPSTASAGANVSATSARTTRRRWDEAPSNQSNAPGCTSTPTGKTATTMQGQSEEAQPTSGARNEAKPCHKSWHRHNNINEPCPMCELAEISRQRSSPLIFEGLADAPSDQADDAGDDDVIIEEAMLADDAHDDDTASHVSDESFGEIDKHLDYEPEDGKASPAIIEDATTTANEGILNVAMEVGTETAEHHWMTIRIKRSAARPANGANCSTVFCTLATYVNEPT